MGAPAKGLHGPDFAHDIGGFGLIASIDDKAGHRLVNTAIAAHWRLTHRGAVATSERKNPG